jgi:hypothetical protein
MNGRHKWSGFHTSIATTAADKSMNRALRKKNEDEDLQAEETEVTALLETGYEGDAMATDCEESSELEYVSDSEADLLLSPPAGLQSP